MACADRDCGNLVKNRPTPERRDGGGALSLADVDWLVGGSRWAAFGGADVLTPCCSGDRLLDWWGASVAGDEI